MKHLLVFAYFYPPINESASRRSGCLAKYLPEFGWRPHVVTRHWTSQNCNLDPDCVSNLPSEFLLEAVPNSDIKHSSPLEARWQRPNWQKFFRPNRYPYQWSRATEQRLANLINKGPYQAVWGTWGPPANLWLAGAAAKRLKIPWVADFRDLAGQEGLPKAIPQRSIALRLQQAERNLARNAATATTTTPSQAKLLEELYSGPVHVVPNGFDPDDFQSLKTFRTSTHFTLVHTGALYPHRTPLPFLTSVAQLIREGKMDRDDVRIHFYGEPPASSGESHVADILHDYEFRDVVEVKPRVPRSECQQACHEATVLMLPGESNQVTVGAKIYDYLAVRRPILVCPPVHCEARRILKETNAGATCDSSVELTHTLAGWYDEWKKTGDISLDLDMESVGRYSRREQARQVASILDDLVAG